MTFRIEMHTTRPDADIPFFSQAHPEIYQPLRNLRQLELAAGNLLSENTEISDDGLVSTYIAEWVNRDVYKTYLSNPVSVEFNQEKDVYNQQYGITIEVTTRY